MVSVRSAQKTTGGETMELDNVIRRIQKCLALGASSNEHEAAAAMRQAQKLMKEYNVSPEHVGQVVVELHRAKSTSCTKPPLWEQWLATGIAKAFGCKVLLHRGWFDSIRNKNGDMGQYSFIGPRHQVMTAAWTMDLLRNKIMAGRSVHIKAMQGCKRAAIIDSGNAYAEAFVMALRRKIEDFAGNSPETEAAIAKMIEDQTGMTQEQRDELAKLFKKEKPGKKMAQGTFRDYEAGSKAGRETSLHRPIGG